MERKLNKLYKFYNEIEVPNEIDRTIEKAILKKHKSEENRIMNLFRNNRKVFRGVFVGLFCGILIFGTCVNTSINFAQRVYEIPILGEFAKIITFNEYITESETSIRKVSIPHVEDENNELIAKNINDIIDKKIKDVLEEQEILDAEYKEAFLATGGTEETYTKIETTVDYKMHYSNENIISFEIYKYQTLANAYNENNYYNIDLKTGDEITIKDLIGENYREILEKNIISQMEDRMEKNSEKYNYDLKVFENNPIDINRSFYINDEGKIIITFKKYEIASGFMGIQTFDVGSI